MRLKETGASWNKLGQKDPLFAILTYKDKLGGKWDEKEFFNTGKREIKEVLDYLKTAKINLSFGKALDFGCGVGRLTLALADYFGEVHGVDIASSMIKMAEKYNAKKQKCFYHLNATDDLKLFPDARFDFVFSKITLQHMEPRYARNYIKEFLRILKPNGLLVFQIPERRADALIGNESWRSLIKKFIPEPIMALYRKFTPSLRPLIEMYSIPRGEIIELVKTNGGAVLDIKEDKSAEKWISYQYAIKKR